MIRLHGGPADGCEVPAARWRVMSVRIRDGEPVYRDGALLTSTVQPRSARDQWVAYCYNATSGDYWHARSEDPPPWYRLPRT